MCLRASTKVVVIAGVALAGCVIVPSQQHALVSLARGEVEERHAVCGNPDASAGSVGERASGALDPKLLRIASWNLHKQQDAGWREELFKLASENDVLLLQEVGLTQELRVTLSDAGYVWLMASSFTWVDTEYGVVIAARARPISFCTGRAFEPLTGIPKSQVVARFRLAGRDDPIAIATIHAVNFMLELGPYERQLDELGDALAKNSGPIVLAGDFNTWSAGREAALATLAARLGLVPVVFASDTRSRFLGQPADWAYARRVQVLGAAAPPVSASDHNPLVVRFRVP